jgi:23S rRNA (adenine2503-C2)-methyltransferase
VLTSSDAWAMIPSELAAQGVNASVAAFSAMQRPWRWGNKGPELAARAAERLAPVLTLPVVRERHTSSDGTTKLVLSFGNDAIEAVHMPRRVRSGQRVTLCISSQAGCAMGCAFCATASMGFHRHLAAGEIVAQVLAVMRELGPRHPSDLTLVFMGMGEPLHNLRNVARAIEVLCLAEGLGLTPRRITVSTSGLVPEIDALGALRQRPLLALSLNATTDASRRALMPVNQRYPLRELHAALTRYPWRPRERATIEYVLLDAMDQSVDQSGVNHSDEDAARLADFCEGFPNHVNLIPFNPYPGALFRTPSNAAIDRFAQALVARRPTLVTVRHSRGRDVQAACGQLIRRGAESAPFN